MRDIKSVYAYWHARVLHRFGRRQSRVLLSRRHALCHPDPKPFTQPITTLQFQMLSDPASPHAEDIFGVEGDFEWPALEAAGSQKKV